MVNRRVIVIGGGASGMMAAGRAAEAGAEVLLLEKTERPGNKILISGKMRCNLTNTAEIDDFIAMYGTNGRFLYSTFRQYFRFFCLRFAVIVLLYCEAVTEEDVLLLTSNSFSICSLRDP